MSREELLAVVAERDALVVLLAERDALLVALGERVADLERRLGGNSRNSSRPPSSEGYAKPAPKSLRGVSGKKSGGQRGSPGATLRQVENPDEVLVHSPATCGGCGAGLGPAPVASVEVRQVADLPEVLLRWVEHRIEHKECSCGCTTMAAEVDGVPAGVNAPVSYGPGVRAAGTYLVAGHFLPLARGAQVLGDLLAAPVSQGSLATWVGSAGQGLEGPGSFTDTVRQALADAPVACFDETGLRVDGHLMWVHSASTEELSLFTVNARRGKVGIDAAGVLPTFTGTAVTDCWAPYSCYPAAAHARCNAHLLRELTGVFEAPLGPGAVRQTWAAKLAKRLTTLNEMVTGAKAAGYTGLDPGDLAHQVAWIQAIIKVGWSQNPEPPGGWTAKRPVAVNLLARFETHQDQFLRFATDFAVPFTNNLAERDIRPVKLRQKISGCLRTQHGAQAFVALRSYLSTATKQGQNLLTVLRQLHDGHPWLPTTTTC